MRTATVTVVAMPRLSDSMEEGTVVQWLEADGDLVAPGDDLVEIETHKATILRQLVAEGDTVGLGVPIAELVPDGGDGEPLAEPVVPRSRTNGGPPGERRPVIRDDALAIGWGLSLTLCSDHRVLNGADAAAFLADIRAGLEAPMRLLI